MSLYKPPMSVAELYHRLGKLLQDDPAAADLACYFTAGYWSGDDFEEWHLSEVRDLRPWTESVLLDPEDDDSESSSKETNRYLLFSASILPRHVSGHYVYQ